MDRQDSVFSGSFCIAVPKRTAASAIMPAGTQIKHD